MSKGMYIMFKEYLFLMLNRIFSFGNKSGESNMRLMVISSITHIILVRFMNNYGRVRDKYYVVIV